MPSRWPGRVISAEACGVPDEVPGAWDVALGASDDATGMLLSCNGSQRVTACSSPGRACRHQRLRATRRLPAETGTFWDNLRSSPARGAKPGAVTQGSQNRIPLPRPEALSVSVRTSAMPTARPITRSRPVHVQTRLTGSRRRLALPAQDEKGDVVSGVLAADQGSHHREANVLRRPRRDGLA
jgi:hypothetical protein